jgi:hypothetical protein
MHTVSLKSQYYNTPAPVCFVSAKQEIDKPTPTYFGPGLKHVVARVL